MKFYMQVLEKNIVEPSEFHENPYEWHISLKNMNQFIVFYKYIDRFGCN